MPTSPTHPLVLLVEDSEDDAFFFRWAIKKGGVACEIIHAPDGAAAIERLKQIRSGTQPRPHVMFLDLKLPTFTGFEILEWIGRNPIEPPLRVVVLSGSDQVSDNSRALSLGAAGYVVKPIAADRLKDWIESSVSAEAS